MSRTNRAELRGSQLKDFCQRAKRLTNEYGPNDNRIFCSGLIDKRTDELIGECGVCKAHVDFAEPLNVKKSKISNNHLMFDCPGCKEVHAVDLNRWRFNGGLDNPTISPSILINHADWPDGKTAVKRCHSFVRDGHIQFLNDCEHDLKNKTVELESIMIQD